MPALRSANAVPGISLSPEHDSTNDYSKVLGLVLSLQERLGVVENSVRDLQGENLALKLSLAECRGRIDKCGSNVNGCVSVSGVGGGVSGGDYVVGSGDSGGNSVASDGDSDGTRIIAEVAGNDGVNITQDEVSPAP